MLRSEAVSQIQEWLGFRTNLTANIITALKNVQVELEGGHELPWFLINEVSSITTVADEERIPVPSDFLREWEDDQLWLFDDTVTDPEDEWTPLLKLSLDQMRLDYPGTGKPKAYAYSGMYWRVGPTPDAVYTLKQIYYKKDAVLDTDIENNWLKFAPDLMIGKAGAKIAIPLRDSNALAAFQQLEAQGANRLLIQTIQYEQANRSNQMGGAD